MPSNTKQKNNIDPSLIRFYRETNFNAPFFANSIDEIKGCFHVESLDIEIAISDEEEEKALKAVQFLQKQHNAESVTVTFEILDCIEIYKKYFQVRNHELAHLIQVITLPYFHYYWYVRTNLLRVEAIVMLKHFENGGYYELSEHETILDILFDNTSPWLKELNSDVNSVLCDIENYLKGHKEEYKGLSLHGLTESMAHIISLCLTEEPDIDNLKIESHPDYSQAYKYFLNSFDFQQLETRWKHLLFIYYCYFSFTNTPYEEQYHNPIDTFIFLCQRTPDFLKLLINSKNNYQKHNIDITVFDERWEIPELDIQYATKEQKSSIFGFFEIIENIDREVRTLCSFDEYLKHEKLELLYEWSKKQGVDWRSKYTLARMLVFPKNYQWAEDLYTFMMEENENTDENSYSADADFYSFVKKCRSLLNPSEDVICCSEHLLLSNRKQILKCQQNNSFSYYLRSLIGREPIDLFRV